MKNRGLLGLGFGLVAGVMAARHGFGVETMGQIMTALFVPPGETLSQHPELVSRELMAVPSISLCAAMVVADSALHSWRKRRSGGGNGPQV